MTTRQNLCPNPAVTNNTTGWGGNSTFARTTGITGMPVSTGISWTGNGFSQTPTGVVAAGDVITVSFYIKNRSAVSITARTVYVAYTRTAGGDAFPETFTVTPGADGTVVRGSFTAAAAPANATGIYLVIDSLNALAGSIEISAVLYEKVAALDTYFDGNSVGGSWDGTAGNSTSTLTSGPAVVAGAGTAGAVSTAAAVARVRVRAAGVAAASSTTTGVARVRVRAAGDAVAASTAGAVARVRVRAAGSAAAVSTAAMTVITDILFGPIVLQTVSLVRRLRTVYRR